MQWLWSAQHCARPQNKPTTQQFETAFRLKCCQQCMMHRRAVNGRDGGGCRYDTQATADG